MGCDAIKENDRVIRLGLFGMFLIAIIPIAKCNFLLFHIISEYFCSCISFLIFSLAIGTYKRAADGSLQILGCAFGVMAILNLYHILTFKGMLVFPGFFIPSENYSSQFWISQQFLLAISLLVAPLLIKRKISLLKASFVFVGIAFLATILIALDFFPVCFIEGQGVTTFKVTSECVIILLITVGYFHLRRNRFKINSLVYKFTSTAIMLIICSELCFTWYTNPYGFENFLGHVLRMIYFGMLFEGIGIELIRAPYNDMFNAYESMVSTLGLIVEMRDEETGGHSEHVAEIAVKIAEHLGMKGEELNNIRHGALLHDLGKVVVPDSILLKPGKLTDEEMEIMKKHTLYAQKLLSNLPVSHNIMEICVLHHEKWDGTGYPFGLKGLEIPISVRIFSLVDVWDALISDRRYRKAIPRSEAIEYLKEQSGKHFDPELVPIFLKLI